MNRFIVTASTSALQKSELFMSIQCVLFTADEYNRNGVAVTEKFLDEIIQRPDKYCGLPLYADVEALLSGGKLTHNFNEKTGEFSNTQIGSFVSFSKEVISGKTCLVGVANCPKRDENILAAISNLFIRNNLKFSFEISCTDYEKIDDEHFIIDASENNFIEGMSIVSVPACPDALALDFCAEKENQEENNMNENELEKNIETPEVTAEVIKTEAYEGENIATEEATEEIVAEQSEVQETSANEETAIAEEPELTAETEEAECKNKSEEEDASCKSKPCSEEEEASCKKPCSEDENASCKKPCSEDEEAECGKKKAEEEPCVEREDDGLKDFITSLVSRIEALEAKLAEFESTAAFCRPAFSNATNFTSEVHVASAEEVNPMVGDMSLDTGWTLLEKEEPRTSWTLL